MDKNYSNPFSFYVDGSTEKNYVYQPGKNPYHVYYKEGPNKGCGWIPFSLMLFADNEDHARKILREGFLFMKKCELEYLASNSSNIILHKSADEYLVMVDKAQITLVDRGQIFKIGWADNDTI